MSFKVASANAENVENAIKEIKGQFQGMDIKAVLYFSTSNCDLPALSAGMESAFAPATVFGCTTAGEIVSGKMLKGSVVAMAMDSAAISDIKVIAVKDLNQGLNVKDAFAAFESHFKEPMAQMDFQKYVGMVLVDGLSVTEEKLMDRIGDLTNVLFIGGSAGDDVKFQTTHVFVEGKAMTNAAVLALLKPSVEFDILKTQSFKVLDKKLTATKVDESRRAVLEFNGKPAVQAYAEVLGVEADKLADHFMSNPVGLIIEGEPYVRSPQQVQDDTVVFYCKVVEGMELSILESGDIVIETKKDLDKKIKKIGPISAIINFHCILRTLELEEKEQTQAYGQLFTDIPTIGFSTYGEEYLGHINQTSTMLVFK